MSGYGKVITGGVQMRKGLTKGINNKLEQHPPEFARSQSIAKAVLDAYSVKNLSGPSTNEISKGGKFKKAIQPTKV